MPDFMLTMILLIRCDCFHYIEEEKETQSSNYITIIRIVFVKHLLSAKHCAKNIFCKKKKRLQCKVY